MNSPDEYAQAIARLAVYNIQARYSLGLLMEATHHVAATVGLDAAVPILARNMREAGVSPEQLATLAATAQVELARAWYIREAPGGFSRGAQTMARLAVHLVAGLPDRPEREDLDALIRQLRALGDARPPDAGRR